MQPSRVTVNLKALPSSTLDGAESRMVYRDSLVAAAPLNAPAQFPARSRGAPAPDGGE